jgi:hypothetical protein
VRTILPLIAATLVGCSSSRVSLSVPDGAADAEAGTEGSPDAVTAIRDTGVVAMDARPSFPDAAPTGNFCRNDCDCDFATACLAGTCQIANRYNMCCSNPFCPVGAQCEEFVCSGCCPSSCLDRFATCGPIGDGCGGVLNCGSCMAPDTCGGGGVPNQCGSPPDAGCVPITCGAIGAGCGVLSDRCGGVLNCGSCTFPEICGGAGTPFVCAAKPPPTCPLDGGPGD